MHKIKTRNINFPQSLQETSCQQSEMSCLSKVFPQRGDLNHDLWWIRGFMNIHGHLAMCCFLDVDKYGTHFVYPATLVRSNKLRLSTLGSWVSAHIVYTLKIMQNLKSVARAWIACVWTGGKKDQKSHRTSSRNKAKVHCGLTATILLPGSTASWICLWPLRPTLPFHILTLHRPTQQVSYSMLAFSVLTLMLGVDSVIWYAIPLARISCVTASNKVWSCLRHEISSSYLDLDLLPWVNRVV